MLIYIYTHTFDYSRLCVLSTLLIFALCVIVVISRNGYAMPVSYLAKRVANVAQVYTQHAFMRAFGIGECEEKERRRVVWCR